MDEERKKARKELEDLCMKFTVAMTKDATDEKKLTAGLNQRMMLEQLDRLLLRHEEIEHIESELFSFDTQNTNVGKLQKQYVERAEGIAQHTYSVISHFIKWLKSILPHPERNMSSSVSNLIKNCIKKFGLDEYWKSVLEAEYDYRTKYVDHPGISVAYTWHTESLPDKRTYVHYHDVGKNTTFSPPHPDLVINAVIGLIHEVCTKLSKDLGK